MNHLPCHHWSNKTGNILGSSGQKITQKQLKMIVSPGRKVFENLKLQNYISNINKYCQVYSAIPDKNQEGGELMLEFPGVN